MIIFYIACFLASLTLLGGTLVLLRSGNGKENRVFFAVSLLAALWSVVFASIELPQNIEVVDFLNKLAYFLGLLLLFAGTTFTYYFPKEQPKKSLMVYGLLLIPIGLLSFTSLIAGTVSYGQYGEYVFNFGSLTWLYTVGFLAGIGLIIQNSVKTRKQLKGSARSQLELVMFGYSLSLIVGIGLSVVVPYFYPNTSVDDLAPSSITIMILLVSYAIIRHKLFDFRAVVARTAGYIFSLVFLGLVYGVFAFYIIDNILLENYTVTQSFRRAMYVALALLFGLSFAPAKKMFDRLSNRLFYRDAYDSQVFIDDFTSILVSNADLNELLFKSSDLIKMNLKPRFTSFVLGGMKKEVIYTKDDLAKSIDKQFTDELFTAIGKKDSTVININTAELTLSKPLRGLLRQKNVELIIKLSHHDNIIGAMLIGDKQSGSAYNSKDKEVFEIIADELSLAVQNSFSYQEIKQFNVTLQEEVEDATKRLRSSNVKLKALDETKDEFISMASHQLRTPLTSIKGYISMVLEGDAGKLNDQQKKMLSQAFVSSQRMNYLISDLLNVSRLKTGKFEIENKPTNLPEVIQGELDQLYDTAKVRGLDIIFEPPKDFPVLNLDETKIRQVIMNFVDNAIYYTGAGGQITIDLSASDKTVELKVIDTGLGVPKKEQHNLFSKFYRADNARRARPDGTGLGLFMAKKVVIAQGGAIIFKSQEGKGSTFGFSFPISKVTVEK